MDEKTIDWLLVGIVIIFFIVAMFFGFGPESKYKSTENRLGGYIACFGFLIYGGAGLLRKRILFGTSAWLLKGWWAIFASSFFFIIGCLGLYEFINKWLLQ